MKRNSYSIMMVLFILAACVPIPGGLDQVTTATQEATTTLEPTSTKIPEPTPTEENVLRVVSIEEARDIIKTAPYPTGFPRITIEDITSGKLQEMEKKWLQEHPISSEAVPVDLVKVTNKNNVFTASEYEGKMATFYEIDYKTDPNLDYQKNKNLIPFEAIGIYNLWDEKLYNESGFFDDLRSAYPTKIDQINQIISDNGTFFSVISFGIMSKDGPAIGYIMSPSYSASGYFNRIFNKISMVNGEIITWDYETKIRLAYDLKYQESFENMLTDNALAMYIWKNYPETSPKSLVDDIVETDSFPKDTGTKLFTFYDNINDPW